MKYIIVKAAHSEYLEEQVNEKISKGWKPIGGLAVVERGKKLLQLQAMIKT